MGKSVHDHRKAAGILRHNAHRFFFYDNEQFLFDPRKDACQVWAEPNLRSENNDDKIFASFLNIKQEYVEERLDGTKYQQTPVITLSLTEIKKRISAYRHLPIPKDSTALQAAILQCNRKFTPHQTLTL